MPWGNRELDDGGREVEIVEVVVLPLDAEAWPLEVPLVWLIGRSVVVIYEINTDFVTQDEVV